MIGALVNDFIVGLRSADLVVVELFVGILRHHLLALFWRGETAVVEAFAVLGPGGGGKL